MLDIGSWEFLLIIVLGIMVIGPKELPGVIRTIGLWVRRAKDLAREFQGGLEDIARETEIDKFKDELTSEIGDVNSIGGDLAETVDPDGEFAQAFDYADGDWYSDHHDDADGETVDAEIAGPPPADAPDPSPDAAAAHDDDDADAKTGT